MILLDPAGEPFRQARASELAARDHLILLCPRYEGVDDRVRTLVDVELSIGDYVLTGGELPALVVIDAGPSACCPWCDGRRVDPGSSVSNSAAWSTTVASM